MNRLLTGLLSLALLGILPAIAQTGVADGSIKGIIRDAAGAATPNASMKDHAAKFAQILGIQ